MQPPGGNHTTEDLLLRYSEEPCRFFHEQDIHTVLVQHANEFLELLERFYLAWQKDESIITQPTKQLFKTEGIKGDLRVMPCIIRGFEGLTIKAVKVIGTNEEQRIVQDKICVGKALLINATDNFAEGVFDVCALSSFRTAAISALAFKHVAAQKEEIGLIGLGRIGYYTALILNQWLGVQRIRVYDIDEQRRECFSTLLQENMTITPCSLAKICQSCSSAFLSTNSKRAILNSSKAETLSFISSVGADADNLSELDQSVVAGRKIYSESRQNIHFGDLGRWHRAGLITEKEIEELRDAVGLNEGGQGKRTQPCLFISTGTAVQDALICHFIQTKFLSSQGVTPQR